MCRLCLAENQQCALIWEDVAIGLRALLYTRTWHSVSGLRDVSRPVLLCPCGTSPIRRESQEVKLGQHWYKCITCKSSHFFISLDLCCLFMFCDVNGTRGLGNRLHLVNKNIWVLCTHHIFTFIRDHKTLEGENKEQVTQWSFHAGSSTYLLLHQNFQGWSCIQSCPYQWSVCAKSGWRFAEDWKEKDTKQFLWQKWLPILGLKLE